MLLRAGLRRMTYPLRKSLLAPLQRCLRAGCGKLTGDDHLLCLDCAEDHRERNLKSMRRTRAWKKVQLWLIE